nr:putative galacturonosyltransferase 11 [Quercus suber]
MRRRAAEYRRPVRRKFSSWIWALLGLFSIAGLVLFVLHHNHHEDRVENTALVRILLSIDSFLCCYDAMSFICFASMVNGFDFEDTLLVLQLVCDLNWFLTFGAVVKMDCAINRI